MFDMVGRINARLSAISAQQSRCYSERTDGWPPAFPPLPAEPCETCKERCEEAALLRDARWMIEVLTEALFLPEEK